MASNLGTYSHPAETNQEALTQSCWASGLKSRHSRAVSPRLSSGLPFSTYRINNSNPLGKGSPLSPLKDMML